MGWKAQLHFILFGAFSVVGIALLLVAVMGKGAAAKQLEDAKSKLDAVAKVDSTGAKVDLPTKKDIDDLKAAQVKYQEEVGNFENKLRTDIGFRLKLNKKEYTDGGAFYSDAVIALENLKKRVMDLKKDPVLPERLRPQRTNPDDPEPNPNAKEFPRPTTNPEQYWVDLNRAWLNLQAQQIPAAQAQLKVMIEVVAVLEKLRAADEFKNTSFQVERFDWQSFAVEASRENTAPWTRREFGVVMLCDPAFALAFVQEMCAPSEKTKGADNDPYKRQFLPMELQQITGEAVSRPHDVGFVITNKMRADFGLGPNDNWDDLSDTRKREITERLAREERLAMPLRYTVKLHALELNNQWSVIAPRQ